jgi:hypothetical protein
MRMTAEGKQRARETRRWNKAASELALALAEPHIQTILSLMTTKATREALERRLCEAFDLEQPREDW